VILLVCTGLGVVNRGFEQYIGTLAKLLSNVPGLDVEVASGGVWNEAGVTSTKITTLNRKSRIVRQFNNPFIWEQRFFLIGLLPLLFRRKPTVIYLGEYRLFAYLSKLRRLFGFSYSLALYTGGQAIPGAKVFDASRDYVHHVTPVYLQACKHLPANRQSVLPHFITDDFYKGNEIVNELKILSKGRHIILSVGLLDCRVKQMNKLVSALSRSPENWFPILLGETSDDTPSIRQMLNEKFGKDGYMLDVVSHQYLGPYFRAAKVFALCSPRESFGLAMVEALYFGLPIVTNDFYEARWVLGPHALYIDARDEKAIEEAIWNQIDKDSVATRNIRKAYAIERFTWENLQLEYVSLFKKMMLGRSLS
jgi:1,2-diacylglycerol 3-alpha-glucosyltransferase